MRDFLPSNEIMHLLAELVCKPHDLREICSSVIFLIDGFDVSQLNMVSSHSNYTSFFLFCLVFLQ